MSTSHSQPVNPGGFAEPAGHLHLLIITNILNLAVFNWIYLLLIMAYGNKPLREYSVLREAITEDDDEFDKLLAPI